MELQQRFHLRRAAISSHASHVFTATALREPRERHPSGAAELRLPRRCASNTARRIPKRKLSDELRDVLQLKPCRIQQQHDDAAQLRLAARLEQLE